MAYTGLEMASLRQEILSELREIKGLLANHILEHHQTEGDAIELRTISDDTARSEITRLFSERRGQALYYEDICDILSLPLEQVVRVCGVLEAEGLIGDSRQLG